MMIWQRVEGYRVPSTGTELALSKMIDYSRVLLISQRREDVEMVVFVVFLFLRLAWMIKVRYRYVFANDEESGFVFVSVSLFLS